MEPAASTSGATIAWQCEVSVKSKPSRVSRNGLVFFVCRAKTKSSSSIHLLLLPQQEASTQLECEQESLSVNWFRIFASFSLSFDNFCVFRVVDEAVLARANANKRARKKTSSRPGRMINCRNFKSHNFRFVVKSDHFIRRVSWGLLNRDTNPIIRRALWGTIVAAIQWPRRDHFSIGPRVGGI